LQAIRSHRFRLHACTAIFELLGLDAVLVPASVRAEDFEPFARQLVRVANIGGLFVTIPHKPASAQLVERCNRAGLLAGSVNAIRRDGDGVLNGALFDGDGLVKALRYFDFDPTGRRVLLVGAGGAGAAIAASLVEAQVARLGLHDIGDRANALARRLSGFDSSVEMAPVDADPTGFDLVINATPLGMRGDDPLPFDVERLDPDAQVVDILMKQSPTPLLAACRARGIVAHPGFEMLVQQVPDHLDFFGYEDAAKALAADLSPVRALLVNDTTEVNQ
jgi:shikimate dehydrogenase